MRTSARALALVLPAAFAADLLTKTWAESARTLHRVRRGTLRVPAALAAGTVLGGALANFADRVGDGAVTDFLDFGVGASRWPAFNLADACVVVGALALGLLVSERPEEKHG